MINIIKYILIGIGKVTGIFILTILAIAILYTLHNWLYNDNKIYKILCKWVIWCYKHIFIIILCFILFIAACGMFYTIGRYG